MSKWFHNAPAGPGCDVLRRSTAKDVYRITGMDHGAIGGPRRYNNSGPAFFQGSLLNQARTFEERIRIRVSSHK